MRPLWADFVMAALTFCAVLLPLEYGGESAVVIAGVVAGALLVFLLLRRAYATITGRRGKVC